MADLTSDQLAFLDYHNVPPSRVLDAEDMTPFYYKWFMSVHDMWIAYGVTPCRAAGHTMRTRAGHCVQCKPANLSFLMRYDEQAELYVAHSPQERMTKVGMAADPEARVNSLNTHGYGAINDWRLVYRRRCSEAGRMEYLVHAALSDHRVVRPYATGEYIVDCQELFHCRPELAVRAVKRVLKDAGQA